MQTHSRLGHDAIKTGRTGCRPAEWNSCGWPGDIAYYHHEKWDGSGYPVGLAGEAIPIPARLMALADVFDALVARRIYKEPLPFEQAVDVIRKGTRRPF